MINPVVHVDTCIKSNQRWCFIWGAEFSKNRVFTATIIKMSEIPPPGQEISPTLHEIALLKLAVTVQKDVFFGVTQNKLELWR